MPPIGLIEFYGAPHVSRPALRAALGVHVGDPVPESSVPIRARLARVPGVAETSLQIVCCDAGKNILFVGIRGSGEPSLPLRAAPRQDLHLPQEITKAGAAFDDAFMAAVMKGSAGEDHSRGYSLMDDPATRTIQETFPALA